MGYDIEFHFDPDERYDKQELLSRFVNAGATLEFKHGNPNYHDPIIVMPCGYGAFLNPGERAIKEGRWVDGRCPRDQEGLEEYLKFAAAVGARLYDPQTKVYITPETIPAILTSLNKFMRFLTGAFGEVRSKKDPLAYHLLGHYIGVILISKNRATL